MPTPLTKADLKNIDNIVNAACEVVGTAHSAHAAGILANGMVDCLVSVRDDMGRYLAFFEDGAGYGWAKPATIEQMRYIEQMATDIISFSKVVGPEPTPRNTNSN